MTNQALDYTSLFPKFDKLFEPNTPEGMGVICFIILAMIFMWFSGVAFKAYYQSKKQIEGFEKVFAGVTHDKISGARREIQREVAQSTKYEKLWKEFDESLILVESTDRLHNTIDAAHFFNTHTLAHGLTENRLLAAVPGILTAIGVIGTFAGLQMGLTSLSVSVTDSSAVSTGEEVEALKRGIFAMIAGASVAFMSSLWGVFSSVIFNFVEKRLERKIRTRITKIQNLLDYLYPRITAEQSLINIEQSSRSSQEKLAELDEKIGHRLQEIMIQATATMKEGISESLNEVLGPAIRQLVDNAHEGSERAFGGLMEEYISKMGGAGERQKEALEKTTASMLDVSSTVTSGVEKLVERIHHLLDSNTDVVQSFKVVAEANEAAISGLQTTSASLGIISETLSRHNETFSAASASLGAVIEKAGHQMHKSTELLGQINTTHQSFIERLQRLYDATDNLAARVIAAERDAGAVLASVNEQFGEMIRTMQEKTESFEGRMGAIGEIQRSVLQETTETMGTASAGVIQRVETLLEQVETVLATSSEGVSSFRHVADANVVAANQLQSVAASMKSSATDLSAHKETLASATSSLSQTASQAADRIESAASNLTLVTEAQRESLHRVDRLQEIINHTGEQLILASTKADEGLSKVNAHFDRVSEALKKHVEELEQAMSKMLREYAEEVREQVSQRMNDWNKQTNEYNTVMTDAVTTIAGIVDEIDTLRNRSNR